MKHIVFAVDAILDAWFSDQEETNSLMQQLLQRIKTDSYIQGWISAASLSTLEEKIKSRLRQTIKDIFQLEQKTKSFILELRNTLSILTSFGFEQLDNYENISNLSQAQVAISSLSIQGDKILVTYEKVFDTLGLIDKATPEEALIWLKQEDENSLSQRFIDLHAQQDVIRNNLEKRICGVLRGGQYILGRDVQMLEEALAEFIGVKHCVAVSSGSDAILIALLALGISVGDEVITTPFTFFSTGGMIALLGAKPVYVDVDPKTYNLDPSGLEEAITPKTKAILPVSLYGQCADFEKINTIARRYNIPVVEDGAQSFGATHKDAYSCSLSTIGCTSFFPSKPLGGYGDGGACFTNDDNLAAQMKQIRIHGQDKRYHHAQIGINGRLDTLQAAILLAKLEVFPAEIKKRFEIGAYYTEAIKARELPIVAPYIEDFNVSVYGQYTIQVHNRNQLQESLKELGVPTAVHYPVCLYRQPGLKFMVSGNHNQEFPVAERLSSRVMSLPMHPYLTTRELLGIVDKLERAIVDCGAYA